MSGGPPVPGRGAVSKDTHPGERDCQRGPERWLSALLGHAAPRHRPLSPWGVSLDTIPVPGGCVLRHRPLSPGGVSLDTAPLPGGVSLDTIPCPRPVGRGPLCCSVAPGPAPHPESVHTVHKPPQPPRPLHVTGYRQGPALPTGPALPPSGVDVGGRGWEQGIKTSKQGTVPRYRRQAWNCIYFYFICIYFRAVALLS